MDKYTFMQWLPTVNFLGHRFCWDRNNLGNYTYHLVIRDGQILILEPIYNHPVSILYNYTSRLLSGRLEVILDR